MNHTTPWEQVLWTADDIADYLQVGARTVSEKYAPRPDFPRALRPGGGYPRWLAHEITDWATSARPAKPAALRHN